MIPEPEFLGYGFSPEALAAEWEELEADLPARGPNCPFTLDLIELALGSTAQLDGARLQGHIDGCEYCRKRFESLQQATQQAFAPPVVPKGAATFGDVCAGLRGFGLVGKPILAPEKASGLAAEKALGLAAKDGLNLVVHRIPLRPEDSDPLPPLNLFLVCNELTAGRSSGGEGTTWAIQLIFQSDQLDREHGNPEAELTRLSSYQVRLGLRGRLPDQDRDWRRQLTTRLDWRADQHQLASPRVEVSIEDPGSLTEVGFSPLEPYGGIDAT
jgi:hypothetical protein